MMSSPDCKNCTNLAIFNSLTYIYCLCRPLHNVYVFRCLFRVEGSSNHRPRGWPRCSLHDHNVHCCFLRLQVSYILNSISINILVIILSVLSKSYCSMAGESSTSLPSCPFPFLRGLHLFSIGLYII